MPQVAAAIAGYFFTYGTVSYWVAYAVAYVAIIAAVGYVMRAITPKPSAGSVDQGTELALKFNPAYPREVVVGTAATGGSLVYATVSGNENQQLWRVIALCDNEIDSCTEIWAPGVTLPISGDCHPGYASCTSHYLSSEGASRLLVTVYKGTSSQSADAALMALAPGGEWTSSHRGRGIAYAIVQMTYDPDAFQTGEPQLFFVIKGAKVYDPRTATTAWSANAALIAAQVMRGFEINGVRVVGLGASEDDIPTAALIEAADDCDEAITLAAGGTEPRYRANAVIAGNETAREIITDVTGAMSGRHIDRGGEVVFLPGVARTAVMHITDADILSDAAIVYTDKRTADQLINTIVSTFVDPSTGWLEGSLPVRKDAAAITEDGDRFPVRRGYRYVTSITQGQRIDEIELRDARKQGRITFALPIWGLELEPGDWFTMESARFTGTKTFVVEGVQLSISSDPSNPAARVQIAARETATSVYSWTTANETQLTPATVTRPIPPLTVSDWAVSVGTLTGGGASIPELRFSWSDPEDAAIQRIEIEYRVYGTTNVYSTTARADAGALSITSGILPGTRMEGRARFVSGIGRFGSWTIWDDETTDSEFVAGSASGTATFTWRDNDTVDQDSSGTTHVIVARLAFPSVDTAGTWEPSAYPGDFNGGSNASLSSGGSWIGAWEIVETTTGGTSGTQIATGTLIGTDDGLGGVFFDMDANALGQLDVVTTGARDLILLIWRTSGSNELQNVDFHFEASYRA